MGALFNLGTVCQKWKPQHTFTPDTHSLSSGTVVKCMWLIKGGACSRLLLCWLSLNLVTGLVLMYVLYSCRSKLNSSYSNFFNLG